MVGVRFLQLGSGAVTLRYFHQDHLGSIAVLTDQTGAVVERDAYDPWGKRRFTNGNDDLTGSITSQTIQGFTGQEMLASVGLVHLNGRVYDPTIGRMTSADPMVPDPLNGQTWNRYSYVINNPLAFTDPTGYCFLGLCGVIDSIGRFINNGIRAIGNFLSQNAGSLIQIAVTAICTASVVCAPLVPLVAAVTAFAIAGITTGNLDYALRAGLIAGVTAVAFQGIGTMTSDVASNFGSGAGDLFRVGASALVGCGSAVASGGKCGAGALSAGVPAFAGPFIPTGNVVLALMANSALGGLASVAGGGKFGNGAVTGAFGYLFSPQSFSNPQTMPADEDSGPPYAMADEGKGGKGLLAIDALLYGITPTPANSGPAEANWGNPDTLQDHFDRHGADFGATDPNDYALKARNFFDNIGSYPTKIDNNGVIRIYDPDTNTFAAYNADTSTRTFFRPDPAIHAYPTNWDYWVDQGGIPLWRP
jgi:RHS repeat-associated protein